MKGVVLPWNPIYHTLSLPSLSFTLHHTPRHFNFSISSSSLESTHTQQQHLTARERRRLKNERRERKTTTNWREEVEEKLIKKPKKEKKSWTEELNLDNLAKLGTQWWVVRVSRVMGQYTAELLARSLSRNFPAIEFKVYAPAINVKRKLKNGSYSIKPKPLFPGCIFLRCVLNKELHDFIRDFDGIGGFIGSKVGNTKKMINKPRPVSVDDMKAIFRQAKEEQEKIDQAFEEEEKKAVLNSVAPNTELEPDDIANSTVDSKPKRRSVKTSDKPPARKNYKLFVPGSTVRVLSGNFSGFAGTLKKLNRKTKLATVLFTIFGKENIVDIDVGEIAPETN
ncbi:hypothetical protein TanjilG_15805 [Lupinus angustifolius]|uniref:NusG-like N-terminal domain-containing protein n=1 Tax=Lupinus angustifolius TaxID=3871 RepID=A0A1J7GND7_LUPAN|nr:PREDICTED: uncharacterized protein LOC109340928 [Lupinus angustifolius]OIV89610.1 hypothetical protein TanjilG_15805 [Lupinus angustifolius]